MGILTPKAPQGPSCSRQQPCPQICYAGGPPSARPPLPEHTQRPPLPEHTAVRAEPGTWRGFWADGAALPCPEHTPSLPQPTWAPITVCPGVLDRAPEAWPLTVVRVLDKELATMKGVAPQPDLQRRLHGPELMARVDSRECGSVAHVCRPSQAAALRGRGPAPSCCSPQSCLVRSKLTSLTCVYFLWSPTHGLFCILFEIKIKNKSLKAISKNHRIA